MLLNAVAALLQFCTVLPVGKVQDFGHLARHTWLFPVAGYVTGGIAALLAWALPSRPLAAAVALAAVLLLSGLNHFDGLCDFGDALSVRESREKRIAVLTDPRVGSGGVGLALIVTLIAFAALQGVTAIAIAILAAEVFAKLSLSVVTAFGNPFHDGIHSALHASARPWFPLAAGILTLPLLFLLDPVFWVLGVAVTMVIAGVMIRWAGILFGGVNGDVAGATHEMVRSAAIAGFVIATPFL